MAVTLAVSLDLKGPDEMLRSSPHACICGTTAEEARGRTLRVTLRSRAPPTAAKALSGGAEHEAAAAEKFKLLGLMACSAAPPQGLKRKTI
jgi:hypothetical protein